MNQFVEFIPIPKEIRMKVTTTRYCGAGHYISTLEEMEKADYNHYLCYLESKGYAKAVDNGKGLETVVFCTHYVKEKHILTIIYMENLNRIDIVSCIGQPLSPRLFYQDGEVQNNPANAKTTLHMLEMYYFGNSFVIQLKNNHFIISDGGSLYELKYLLDYLDKLHGQEGKPIVDAWIISHAHGDHAGALAELGMDDTLKERLYVEGIYFNMPNDEAFDQPWMYMDIARMKVAADTLRTTKGTHPEIYRPQTGQRYYFNDVTMDVLHAQDQLPRSEYRNQDYAWDFNDSSTWYLFTIEGQKVLFTGDGDVGSMDLIRKIYGREHLGADIMTLPHHSLNTYTPFTDDCPVKVVLQTSKDRLHSPRKEENAYLRERVEEWIAWGDGTKVFEFPYKVGTYKSLSQNEWIYHKGMERPEQAIW